MARATIAKTALLGSYPTLPIAANGADFVFAALNGSSGSNGNQIAFGDFKSLLVLARNVSADTARTITFTSKVDALNRTGDIAAYSIGFGEFAVFFFERDGWRQTDGMLYCEGSTVDITLAVFGLN